MIHPKDWKYESSCENGFHTVVSPQNSVCKETYIFRINLNENQTYELIDSKLELNAAVIQGAVELIFEHQSFELNARDSFYLPANKKIQIIAKSDVVIFIGGAIYDNKGAFYTRKYDLQLTDGNIRQIHGQEPFRRDVFMTVSQHDEASRLICGITFGDNGKWTSWPPHQHTKDLEEVYCYFDIPQPKFALHLCSRVDGKVEYVHPVSTGDCVVVPEGYHPTVGMPGIQSCYFWVMVAHRPESRRYDLAINDPSFI